MNPNLDTLYSESTRAGPETSDSRRPAFPLTPEQGVAWIRAQESTLCRYLRLLGATLDETPDLMQEAFVRVLRDYRNLGSSAQVALLRTIARHRFIDLRRSQARTVEPWTDAVDAWLAERRHALDDQHPVQLATCLRELSPRARKALFKRHSESRSVNDLANEMEMSRNGMRSLLQRSRSALRACLARHGLHLNARPVDDNRSEQRSQE